MFLYENIFVIMSLYVYAHGRYTTLGESALKFLTKLYNRTMESERMPEEWRDSVLIPIFKNKGDVQSCSNYRGIKLISHTMKL